MLATSRLVATVGAAALTTAAAAPAIAADPPSVGHGKSGQTAAVVSWVEEDHEDSTGRPGSVHVGGLFFENYDGSSNVFAGYLADWDCPVGTLPWGDGGQECALLAEYEAAGGDVTLDFDRRAGTARVTGSVTFYDLAGLEEDMWTVPVDLTWTTEGRPVRSREHVVELSSTFKFVSHLRTQTWSTVRAAGTVGTMVLGDEPGELNEERLWHDEHRFLIWTRPGDGDGDGDGGGDGGGMG
jgi:hypothetical protein